VPGKIIDFVNVSTKGLTSSPFAETLAGLRASEAKYLKTHHNIDFETFPAKEVKPWIDYVNKVLMERDIKIKSKPLEAAQVKTADSIWTFVYYQSGLGINVAYHLTDPKKRAVGIKLSYGMEIPEELATKFKFAKMKSKLAIEVRGSYFVIKGEY
jgi:hypothetical protein